MLPLAVHFMGLNLVLTWGGSLKSWSPLVWSKVGREGPDANVGKERANVRQDPVTGPAVSILETLKGTFREGK